MRRHGMPSEVRAKKPHVKPAQQSVSTPVRTTRNSKLSIPQTRTSQASIDRAIERALIAKGGIYKRTPRRQFTRARATNARNGGYIQENVCGTGVATGAARRAPGYAGWRALGRYGVGVGIGDDGDGGGGGSLRGGRYISRHWMQAGRRGISTSAGGRRAFVGVYGRRV